MKNKKNYLVLFFLEILFSLQFISANLEQSLDDFSNAIGSIFGFIIGDVSNGELLLIKALVFLLLLAMINFAVKRMNLFDNKINAVVSIIVSLIAIRFITADQLVKFIWLPYGGLGVLLASILPFIIFFFFIEGLDSGAVRKVGWVSFIGIYLLLGYMRFDDFIVGPEWWQNLAWVYIIIAVVSLIVLLFEKSIRRAMLISSIRKGYDTSSILLRSGLQKELRKINEALASSSISKREENKLKEEMKRIERAIRRIS